MSGLYADENFPLPVVDELRRLGVDVLTMYDDNKANQSLTDEEVLAIAHTGQRALITMNRRDFIKLHTAKLNHFGIIVCTFDPDFAGQARRIADAFAQQANLLNQLIRINRKS